MKRTAEIADAGRQVFEAGRAGPGMGRLAEPGAAGCQVFEAGGVGPGSVMADASALQL